MDRLALADWDCISECLTLCFPPSHSASLENPELGPEPTGHYLIQCMISSFGGLCTYVSFSLKLLKFLLILYYRGTEAQIWYVIVIQWSQQNLSSYIKKKIKTTTTKIQQPSKCLQKKPAIILLVPYNTYLLLAKWDIQGIKARNLDFRFISLRKV